MEKADHIGMVLLILPENGSGLIRRSVIRHKHFKREIRLLGKKTVQRIADILFVIIGGTIDGNLTFVAHEMHLVNEVLLLYTERQDFSRQRNWACNMPIAVTGG